MRWVFIIILLIGFIAITLISCILIVPLLVLTETEWFNYPFKILRKNISAK